MAGAVTPTRSRCCCTRAVRPASRRRPCSDTGTSRPMSLLPDVGFVNAYGLTETSSTIAVLGPDDHQAAFASSDPTARARLGSVGRPLPSVEVTIRDPDGNEVTAGDGGEIWVRGEQ